MIISILMIVTRRKNGAPLEILSQVRCFACSIDGDNVIVDMARFPSGMNALTDQIHELGL